MKTELKVFTEINETKLIKLSGSNILEMLRLFLKHKEQSLTIPPQAGVFVDVPSGGHWSGQELDIDDQTVLTITWQEKRHETGISSLF